MQHRASYRLSQNDLASSAPDLLHTQRSASANAILLTLPTCHILPPRRRIFFSFFFSGWGEQKKTRSGNPSLFSPPVMLVHKNIGILIVACIARVSTLLQKRKKTFASLHIVLRTPVHCPYSFTPLRVGRFCVSSSISVSYTHLTLPTILLV